MINNNYEKLLNIPILNKLHTEIKNCVENPSDKKDFTSIIKAYNNCIVVHGNNEVKAKEVDWFTKKTFKKFENGKVLFNQFQINIQNNVSEKKIKEKVNNKNDVYLQINYIPKDNYFNTLEQRIADHAANGRTVENIEVLQKILFTHKKNFQKHHTNDSENQTNDELDNIKEKDDILGIDLISPKIEETSSDSPKETPVLEGKVDDLKPIADIFNPEIVLPIKYIKQNLHNNETQNKTLQLLKNLNLITETKQKKTIIDLEKAATLIETVNNNEEINNNYLLEIFSFLLNQDKDTKFKSTDSFKFIKKCLKKRVDIETFSIYLSFQKEILNQASYNKYYNLINIIKHLTEKNPNKNNENHEKLIVELTNLINNFEKEDK